MNWILALLLAFQVAIAGPAKIAGPSKIVGTPPAGHTITQLCANASGTSCTGLTVANGAGIVAVITSENSAPAYTITDPCSDTYTQSSGSPVYNSSVVTTVSLYSTKATCSISGGTISVSGATVSVLALFSTNTFTASDTSIYAAAQPSLTSSWSAGPTANITATDACIGGIMSSNSNTFSAGATFTLASGSNQVVDGRNSAFIYEVVNSGIAVTFQATASGSASGSLLGQCVKF